MRDCKVPPLGGGDHTALPVTCTICVCAVCVALHDTVCVCVLFVGVYSMAVTVFRITAEFILRHKCVFVQNAASVCLVDIITATCA